MGTILGMEKPTAFLLIASLFIILAVFRLFAGIVAILLCVIVLSSVGLLSFIEIKGNKPIDWCLIYLEFLIKKLKTQDESFSLALKGFRPNESNSSICTVREFRSIEIFAEKGSNLGLVFDKKFNLLNVVLETENKSFSFKEEAEKNGLAQSWGRLLSMLNIHDIKIERLSYQIRRESISRENYLNYQNSHPAKKAISDAFLSYQELLETAITTTGKFRTFLVVGFSANKLNILKKHKLISPKDLDSIKRECKALIKALNTTGIIVKRALSMKEIERNICSSFHDAKERTYYACWPEFKKEDISYVEIAGNFQAVFWVATWPAKIKGCDFLSPLLLNLPLGAQVAICFEPLAKESALLRVQRERTQKLANLSLRESFGFQSGARQKKELQDLDEIEGDFVSGHTQFRFAGYVKIGAPSLEELERKASEVESLATQSFLELRRLYGHQLEALTFFLPVCRGLD